MNEQEEKRTIVNFLNNLPADQFIKEVDSKWIQEVASTSGKKIRDGSYPFYQYSTVKLKWNLGFTIRRFSDLVSKEYGILDVYYNCKGSNLFIKRLKDDPHTSSSEELSIKSLYYAKRKEVDEYNNKLRSAEIKEGKETLEGFLKMLEGGKK